MTGVFVAAVLASSAIGYGAAVLHVLRLHETVTRGEAVTIGFAVGMGFIGWLLFPLGVAGFLGTGPLVALIVIGCIGLLTLPGFRSTRSSDEALAPLSAMEMMLLAALAVSFGFDLIEGVAPPVDADSFAYHFAIPKAFIAAGRIYFIPVAVDGAVPLLLQLTYLPALSLGGERALTLWTFISGWMCVALVYVAARGMLGRPWALAVALIFATTPAVIYGAGTGQVEMRTALFATAGAMMIVSARRADRGKIMWASLFLAGMCAGFFAAGKYFGVAYIAAGGLLTLCGRQWIARGSIFALGALLAGGQWYLWNALHTGDPFFPQLFDLLGRPQAGVWDQEYQRIFESSFESEAAVPTSLAWFFFYPFKAMLDGLPVFESGRTGFGPFLWIASPFALVGIWLRRQRILTSDATIYAAIGILFYAFWFFSGVSQRLRHLLPILPMALITMTVAAERCASRSRMIPALALAVIMTSAIQLGVHALFTLDSVHYLVSRDSRNEYYARIIPYFEPIAWINEHLRSPSRVLTDFRWYAYLTDIPTVQTAPDRQAVIDLRKDAHDTARFLTEIRGLGISHIVAQTDPRTFEDPDSSVLSRFAALLSQQGCLRQVASFESQRIASRTLRLRAADRTPLAIYEVASERCPGTGPQP